MGFGAIPSVLSLFLILFAIDWIPVRDDTRLGQMRFLLLIGLVVSSKWLKKLLGLPLALLFSYGGILWVLYNYQARGAMQLFCVIAAIAVGKWFADWESFPDWLVNFAVLQAVFGLAQYFGWDPYGYVEPWFKNKPTGLMGQETLLGAFLAAALAPALFRGRYLSSAVILLCIYATHSTMSALAAGAVIFLWLWRLEPILAIALTGLMGFALGIVHTLRPDHPFFSATGRVEFWQLGYAEHLKRPTFGWGPGAWQDKQIVLHDLWLNYLHNEFIELLVEYGRVGATLAALALLQFLWRFRLTWHHAMCAAILVNACGNFPLHLAATGTLFVTGWILSMRRATIKGCVT